MTHIFLYGPSGTGKSTIGQLLAEKLRIPFIDLDRVIETNAGMPIPQIMKSQGETAFRDMETATLKESVGHAFSAINSQTKVIALGGGALLRDENRQVAEKNGKVILLTAGLDTLIARLENDPNERPLLTGDLREKLSAMLAWRGDHYASFAGQLPVDNQSAEQVAHQLQVQLGRHHLSSMGEYDVIVGQVSNLTNFHMQNPIIVTDSNVAKFHLTAVASALQII